MRRYFAYKDYSAGEIYALFCADFEERLIKAEWAFNRRSMTWQQAENVSKWYFLDDTDMDEISESEATAWLREINPNIQFPSTQSSAQ